MLSRFFVLILSLSLMTGCSTTREWDSNASKWLVPVNAAAAYFGSVALHEGGHATSAWGLGADDVDVDILPTRDREGTFHLGLTTYRSRVGELSEFDHTLISAMGTTAQFFGHVSSRALLRSRRLPRIIQPTIAWFGLFNQVGYYFHVINGLARNKRTDLGKHDVWISGVMLFGGLTVDLIDLWTEDKIENRFLVLFGEYFYEPEYREHARLRLISQPRHGGGFLGIQFDW